MSDPIPRAISEFAINSSDRAGIARLRKRIGSRRFPGNHTPLTVRLATRHVRPCTPTQLHNYIQTVLGFRMPVNEATAGHTAPFEYLCHSFFEHRQPRDCIVWANRGGGKTQLAAIATLLDMLFKPGIQIRIVGGSLEQSSKMHRYLRQLLQRDILRDLVSGKPTLRHVELVNGSRVEALAQSERAIRGQRVHKIRCDELELFDREIWDAAQLVTRSGMCGDMFVAGAIEAFSTMHRPHGLVQEVIEQSQPHTRKIFKWNLLDTLEQCEARRACAGCLLWDECGGGAKSPRVQGFIAIDDAIQQKQRVGMEAWASEVLCRQPRKSEMVYPEFDSSAHVSLCDLQDGTLAEAKDVSEFSGAAARAEGAEPCESTKPADLPRAMANNSARSAAVPATPTVEYIGGIDFGYRAPTVLLLARRDRDGNAIHIIDELVVRLHTTEQIIAMAREKMDALGIERVAWIGADPAGHQRGEHTGLSTIALWRRAGFTIRTRATAIDAGIQAVRARLRRADGSVGLCIDPRCQTLIKAMTCYRYPSDSPESLTPIKDGHDHAADALRYLIVNLDRAAPLQRRRY